MLDSLRKFFRKKRCPSDPGGADLPAEIQHDRVLEGVHHPPRPHTSLGIAYSYTRAPADRISRPRNHVRSNQDADDISTFDEHSISATSLPSNLQHAPPSELLAGEECRYTDEPLPSRQGFARSSSRQSLRIFGTYMAVILRRAASSTRMTRPSSTLSAPHHDPPVGSSDFCDEGFIVVTRPEDVDGDYEDRVEVLQGHESLTEEYDESIEQWRGSLETRSHSVHSLYSLPALPGAVSLTASPSFSHSRSSPDLEDLSRSTVPDKYALASIRIASHGHTHSGDQPSLSSSRLAHASSPSSDSDTASDRTVTPHMQTQRSEPSRLHKGKLDRASQAHARPLTTRRRRRRGGDRQAGDASSYQSRSYAPSIPTAIRGNVSPANTHCPLRPTVTPRTVSSPVATVLSSTPIPRSDIDADSLAHLDHPPVFSTAFASLSRQESPASRHAALEGYDADVDLPARAYQRHQGHEQSIDEEEDVTMTWQGPPFVDIRVEDTATGSWQSMVSRLLRDIDGGTAIEVTAIAGPQVQGQLGTPIEQVPSQVAGPLSGQRSSSHSNSPASPHHQLPSALPPTDALNLSIAQPRAYVVYPDISSWVHASASPSERVVRRVVSTSSSVQVEALLQLTTTPTASPPVDSTASAASTFGLTARATLPARLNATTTQGVSDSFVARQVQSNPHFVEIHEGVVEPRKSIDRSGGRQDERAYEGGQGVNRKDGQALEASSASQPLQSAANSYTSPNTTRLSQVARVPDAPLRPHGQWPGTFQLDHTPCLRQTRDLGRRFSDLPDARLWNEHTGLLRISRHRRHDAISVAAGTGPGQTLGADNDFAIRPVVDAAMTSQAGRAAHRRIEALQRQGQLDGTPTPLFPRPTVLRRANAALDRTMPVPEASVVQHGMGRAIARTGWQAGDDAKSMTRAGSRVVDGLDRMYRQETIEYDVDAARRRTASDDGEWVTDTQEDSSMWVTDDEGDFDAASVLGSDSRSPNIYPYRPERRDITRSHRTSTSIASGHTSTSVQSTTTTSDASTSSMSAPRTPTISTQTSEHAQLRQVPARARSSGSVFLHFP